MTQTVAVAAGVSALAFSTLTLAQTAPPQTTQPTDPVSTDTDTPSPVQVISAIDLQESGFTNTQEVLKNLTANGQGTLSQSFSGAFASGAAGIALRGLNV